MSGSTSVPQIQFTDTGPVAPTEAAIVAGLGADFNAAFGGNLNLDPSTPQGQLITSIAAILGDNYNTQVALFNSVDPAFATGRMQDAIGRIYFLTRNPAEPTVLQVTCGGLPGVVIPVGSLVADTSGFLYSCTGAGVIGAGGTVALSFSARLTGPTAVPASVSIYRAIPGWNTAAVVSGVVGNAVEGTSAFEARRQATVAANGAGFLPAIAGAVAIVPGVLDFYATENSTGFAATIGGVTVAANSIFVCVAGGASADIAQAIWTKKNPGCGYTGSTSVTVYDSNSGYSAPLPSYVVKYQVPTAKATCFAVRIANSASVPANVTALVAGAILAAFNGQDGGDRARIGSEIFASRFYAGVAQLGPWARIVSLLVGSQASPTASFTGALAGTVLAVSSVTGTIAIGHFVFGVGVAHGTVITGGSGATWAVSVSQTVTSVAMVSVAAANNDVTLNIDQIPTLVTADVTVALV